MGDIIGVAGLVILLLGGAWLFLSPIFSQGRSNTDAHPSTAKDAETAEALRHDADNLSHHPGDHGHV
jgi:hypothetical protein